MLRSTVFRGVLLIRFASFRARTILHWPFGMLLTGYFHCIDVTCRRSRSRDLLDIPRHDLLGSVSTDPPANLKDSASISSV